MLILKLGGPFDLASVVGDFLSIDRMTLPVENSSESKWYSQIYRRFLDKIRFDEGYLHAVANSRFHQHFFTDDERESMFAKWSGGAFRYQPDFVLGGNPEQILKHPR